MDMKYLTLRKQLDDLGYKEKFPVEAVTLVEKLTADLIQTTKSLQHYMQLSKNALKERDDLRAKVDPYICDNTKLIKENNQLHCQLVNLREEFDRCSKKNKRKLQSLENCVSELELENRTLKNRCRDHELTNLRADTFSSRSKYSTGFVRQCCPQENKSSSTSEACGCTAKECCYCGQLQNQIETLTKRIKDYKENNSQLVDEIEDLKSQVINRDKENIRLVKLLEGGRPMTALQRDCCGKDLDRKMIELSEELKQYEKQVHCLNCELKECLEKQHEAMNRAIQLSDRNCSLEKELRDIDQLALQAEADFNKSLKEKLDVISTLQCQLDNSVRNFNKIEKELNAIKKCKYSLQEEIECVQTDNESLKCRLEEIARVKERLLRENKSLLDANRKMEMCISKDYSITGSSDKEDSNRNKADSGNSSLNILQLLEKERNFYEQQINEVKKQLEDMSKSKFDQNNLPCLSCKKITEERDFFRSELTRKTVPSEGFVVELKNRICELEQSMQRVKEQNEMLASNNNALKMLVEKKTSPNLPYNQSVMEDLQITVNKLERDLKRANFEIQNLEEERDILKSKMRSYATKERHMYSPPMETHTVYYDKSPILQNEIEMMRERLKSTETELLHLKSLNNQLKAVQFESDRNIASAQTQSYERQREMHLLQEQIKALEKNKLDLEHECSLLKTDKISLRENLSKLDQERDKLIMDMDHKTEKLSASEHELRSKLTVIEMLENRVNELEKKLELQVNTNSSLEHRWRDSQTRFEALSIEADSIAQQRDSAIIENKRLQNDLATITNDFKDITRKYENSRKEVDEMRQQLQHYVDEVRRIEDILSRKEAERTEMLDHFASLSHEATVLESNNHSLENEAATKNAELKVTMERLNEMEKKLESRESLIDMQEEKMTKLIYNISKLESELTQQKELTKMAEKNLEYARETCATLEKQKKTILIGAGQTDSERKDLEYTFKLLKNDKMKLEEMYIKDKSTIESLESLLSSSRREVVELKLRLQEVKDEYSDLKVKYERLQTRLREVEGESYSSRQRTEAAAKNLQELQWQMNDQRFQRIRTRQDEQSHGQPSTSTI